MLVQAGLGGVRRFLEVLAQIFLAHVEQFDLGIGLEVAALDEILEPPPGRFDLLECRMMEHFVELPADALVDAGDVTVEQGLVDLLGRCRLVTDHVEEDLQGCGQALVGADIGHALEIAEGRQIDAFLDRFDVDEIAEFLVNAAGLGFLDFRGGDLRLFLYSHVRILFLACACAGLRRRVRPRRPVRSRPAAVRSFPARTSAPRAPAGS